MFDSYKGKSLVQMKIHANQQNAEIERLRSAIVKTLDENRQLADGENCTLIHLKRAIGL